MVDIDTNTALLIAVITAVSAVIGGLISSGTNFLIAWQMSRNEEKRRQQEEKSKALSLRYQAYIEFLGVTPDDLDNLNKNGEEYFDPNLINKISSSVITYGSPKVSSLLARSFPLGSWESIEKTKRMITSELVLEKDGKLSLSAGMEIKELDAYMGIPPNAKAKHWYQFWK